MAKEPLDWIDRWASYLLALCVAAPAVLIVGYAVAFAVGNPPVSNVIGFSILGGVSLAITVLTVIIAQFVKRLFRTWDDG